MCIHTNWGDFTRDRVQGKECCFSVSAALAAIIGFEAVAFEGVVSPGSGDGYEVYSPFVDREYPDEVLFGDLHFHCVRVFSADSPLGFC